MFKKNEFPTHLAGVPWLRDFSCCAMDGSSGPYVAMHINVGTGGPTETPKTLSMTVNSSNLSTVTGKMRQLADQLEAIASR